MTDETPEGWRPDAGDDVDEVLGLIEQEAATHSADYAAGMREARRIVEAELRTGGN
jgi:hypothetical protein